MSSIFDPRKVFDLAHGSPGAGSRPDRPELRLSKAQGSVLIVEWDDPDDGGDEIFLYQLQLAEYSVKWLPDEQAFFDDFLPYVTVHEGPQRVHNREFVGLRTGTSYRLRLRAHNGQGESEWSTALEVEIPRGERSKADEGGVPRSWLTADYSDLITQAAKRQPELSAATFYAGITAALLPHVALMRKVYFIPTNSTIPSPVS